MLPNPSHPVPSHMQGQPFHPVNKFPNPNAPHVMQPNQYMTQKQGAMIPEQMRPQPTPIHGQYPTELFDPNNMPHQSTQPQQMVNMPPHSGMPRGMGGGMGQPYPTNPKMMMPSQNMERNMHPNMYSMGNVPPNMNMQMQLQQQQQQARMQQYHIKNYNNINNMGNMGGNMNTNMPGNVGGNMGPGTMPSNMGTNMPTSMGSTMRAMNPQMMNNQVPPDKMKKK